MKYLLPVILLAFGCNRDLSNTPNDDTPVIMDPGPGANTPPNGCTNPDGCTTNSPQTPGGNPSQDAGNNGGLDAGMSDGGSDDNPDCTCDRENEHGKGVGHCRNGVKHPANGHGWGHCFFDCD